MKRIFTLILGLVAMVGTVSGQISIPNTTAVTQNFNAIGATATASLPSGWKMNAQSAGASPTWGAVGNVTATTVQANSGTPTAGGRYNWGNGGDANDRAIGFMTSGSYGSPNSVMAHFQNNTGSVITDLNILFDIERYRINTAAASVTFFYSLNGTDWTEVLAGATGAFSTAASVYNFTTGTVVSRDIDISALSIANGAAIYLRWNFNTTGGNSQGLGLDNVSVSATLALSSGPDNPTSFDAAVVSDSQINLSWALNGSGDAVIVAVNSSSTFGDPTVSYSVNDPITGGGTVIYSGTGTAFNHTALTSGTPYYYKIWSYDGSEYSSGAIDNAATLISEPTNEVSDLTVSSVTSRSFLLEFTDATDAEGYIVLGRTGSAPTDTPVDGTSYDTGVSIGSSTVLAFTLTAAGRIEVSKLTADTQYQIAIYPLAWDGTNTSSINYRTSGSPAIGTINTLNQATSSMLLVDNFTTASGQLLSDLGYTVSSAGLNSINANGTGLTYSGYSGAGVGRALTLSTTGEDISYNFGQQTSGSIFLSAMISLSAAQATGDYFLHYRDEAGSFFGRLFAKSSGAGFVLGISKGNETVVYDATERSFGTTYLVVMEYSFEAAIDSVNLYVNPAISSTIPVPTIAYVGGTDAANIAQLGIRQGNASNAPTPTIDGIRIATTWGALLQNALQSTLTGTAGWRLLSSPVSGSTYANVLGPIWTQGATGSDAPSNGTTNVFWSQGSTTASLVQTGVTDLTTALTPGRGFAVYVYNDDNYDAPGGDSWPKTLSVTGAENAANATYTPTWTSGIEYAIAGNPFASTIDWDNVTKGANVHNAVWVWNPATSTYDDYNGANGNLTGGLIAPFQGFWVQYNGTDRGITFPSGAKSTGGSFRGKEEAPRRMVIRASDSAGSNLAWVAFREGATLGEDRYDAVKFTPLSSDYLQAFTIAADKAHGINVLPSDLTDELEIPLGVTSTRGGTITLDLQELNLPDGWAASLRDNVTGVTMAVDANFSYSYESSRAKAAPVGEATHILAATAPRFTLIVDPLGTTSTENGKQTTENFELAQNYPNPFNPSTVVGFRLSVAGQATLKVYDVLGREVAVLVNGTLSAGAHSVTFDASNLTSGVYMYKLEAGGMTQVRRMTLVK